MYMSVWCERIVHQAYVTAEKRTLSIFMLGTAERLTPSVCGHRDEHKKTYVSAEKSTPIICGQRSPNFIMWAQKSIQKTYMWSSFFLMISIGVRLSLFDIGICGNKDVKCIYDIFLCTERFCCAYTLITNWLEFYESSPLLFRYFAFHITINYFYSPCLKFLPFLADMLWIKLQSNLAQMEMVGVWKEFHQGWQWRESSYLRLIIS